MLHDVVAVVENHTEDTREEFLKKASNCIMAYRFFIIVQLFPTAAAQGANKKLLYCSVINCRCLRPTVICFRVKSRGWAAVVSCWTSHVGCEERSSGEETLMEKKWKPKRFCFSVSHLQSHRFQLSSPVESVQSGRDPLTKSHSKSPHLSAINLTSVFFLSSLCMLLCREGELLPQLHKSSKSIDWRMHNGNSFFHYYAS